MINVSKEFKEKIKYGRFLLYLTITLADGTVLNLDDSNIWEGGFKIDEGVKMCIRDSCFFCRGGILAGIR